ncbi:MAG: FAD-dependent oxidoreductase [Pseudomonadota bacterium]
MNITAGGKEHDIVIVGAGGAGMAAAIEAARSGMDVLLVEKAPQAGGTTAWSVGSYTTSGTEHQRRAGIEDSSEAHFEDMGLFNSRVAATDNLALRRLLTEEAPATFRWLTDLGVTFIGPNLEPPHRVARMHNVIPNAGAFPYFLLKECSRLGVTIECGRELVDLLFTDGRVSGVVVSDGSAGETRHARHAVILATGDFAANARIKARFFGPEVRDAEPVNPLATGEGIEVAERYGATIVNGHHANAPRMRFVPAPSNWMQRIPPARVLARMIGWGLERLPHQLMRPVVMRFLTTALGPEPTLFRCGAVLVDKRGAAVELELGHIARHLPATDGNIGYIVFDGRVASQLETWPNFVSTAPGVAYAYLRDYLSARKDICSVANTIEDLARKIGANAGELRRSLALATLPDGMNGPATAPYYALGPVRGYVTITEGGLAVNERLQVSGAAGEPVPGLYAAGSCGQGGMLLEGHGHHIAWAFVSGRLAARAVLRAAQEAPTDRGAV